MRGPGTGRVHCLVLGALPEPELDIVRRSVPENLAELVIAPAGAELSGLGQFEVIWRRFPGEDEDGGDQLPAALEAHPEVRWVHTVSAGIDHLVDLFIDRPQIILTTSAGVTAVPIAEFVVACLLHHVKRFSELEDLQRQSQFEQLLLREMGDLQVVLLGLGAIATEVVRRLVPFGCRITAVRRDASKPAPPGVDLVRPTRELARACRDAGALVLVAPLTAETEGVVNDEVLSQLAEGSALVNVARGGLVDEGALIKGMKDGRPVEAYLDAFVEEPVPSSSPLWTAPGIHISPHLSWSSSHLGRRSSELFGEQLSRWIAGKPLLNRADPRAGY